MGAALLVAVLAAGVWLINDHGSRARTPSERQQSVVAAYSTHDVIESFPPDGKVQPKPTRPSLDNVLSLDSRVDYAVRADVLRKMYQSGLPQAQLDRLMIFIRDQRLPDGLSPSQLLVLKNDALNVLGLQKEFQPKLAVFLGELARDPSVSPAVRDYALQQLGTLAILKDSTAIHWQVIHGADSSLAATAMIHVLSLDRTNKLSDSDRLRLADAALRLAGDATQPETCRTTALQVCGQLKLVEAQQLAWNIARMKTAGYPLRIAAVATLGQLGGGSEVKAYLEQLVSGSERRLHIPAKAALKQISFY